ncbi:hypothetical protein [Scytonema sp. HK-05]|uniref:hypothetical protein n=1 Tax=Scytonema sp. HK-05 TaxID=1137095 RepID=UPI0009356C4A|nr:hypothetical protein [Scytonema sp. HK-05]OKH55643.1 hypothetical protein NIES2130_26450 [Scytonema sp. HK-05]
MPHREGRAREKSAIALGGGLSIAFWAGTCANAQRARKERESLSPYGHALAFANGTRCFEREDSTLPLQAIVPFVMA